MIRTITTFTSLILATAILSTAGTIGPALNLCNPQWNEFGVSAGQLHHAINEFPISECGEDVRPVCRKLSDVTLWFLGIEGHC
jgi:hypothetical protein